jgi:RNA polymerase sigma factor (sigma-70 family)
MPRVTSLIARFKSGSRSAFHGLFQTYFRGQVTDAGRRLGAAAAGPADAEDVALSVFHSLWREVTAGRPLCDGLTDRDSLLRTLALLTAQKVRRARRDARRHKRDERRTVRAADRPAGAAAPWADLADPSLAPEWQACFRETWAELMAALTPRQRTVVEWKFDNRSNPEIAEHVGRSVRTVERDLSEIRSVWEELYGGTSAE